MGRRSRLVLAALTAGLLTAGFASAGVPDPGLSDAPNVIVSPQGNLEYVVTVVGSSGPIDTALVQLIFSDEADTLVCWCSGETHPLIEAVTNSAGEASFFIAGGGCVEPSATVSGLVVEVFANGIKLAEVGVVSPDAVDGAGILPTGGWNPGVSCAVGLSDATVHTAAIASGTYEFCTDIDSDLIVSLADAVTLTAPIAGGDACTAE